MVNCRILIAGFWLIGTPGLADNPQLQPAGDWRLLRSVSPRGGEDAVSMTRSAEIASDRDLAGLILRCHHRGAEVVIVVVTPFSPHAEPSVTIAADGRQWRFEASVVPPGAELLLPAEAADLAAGVWQASRQLRVRISLQEQSIGGVIPIDGLAGALGTLIANCPVS
jgi:hypothetical protein